MFIVVIVRDINNMLLIYVSVIVNTQFKYLNIFFYRELGLLRQRRNAGNDRFSKKRPRSNCKKFPLSQPMFCKHVSSSVECFLLYMYTRIKLTSLVNDLIYKHKHELGGRGLLCLYICITSLRVFLLAL